MSRPLTEARFALGTRLGPRSTIWKAWVQGDEAYIASRMFGSDLKVSIHSSGECQVSRTDSWVKRQENFRNAERHVHRWHISAPVDHQAVLVFQVGIPVSELRDQEPPTDKKKVVWVSGIPNGVTVRFLFYVTQTVEVDPGAMGTSQARHLFSLRMRSGRWFVVFVDTISLSASDIDEARCAALDQARAVGILPNRSQRLSLFNQPNSLDGVHGLMELCSVKS
jgi:hypothetical protein